MAIGKPWIKGGSVDRKELAKAFREVRFGGDAISLQDCFNMIVDRINEAEEIKTRANEKVKRYEEEINADVRVQELTTQLKEAKDDLYRGFGISEEEAKAISDWKEMHDIEQHSLKTLDEKLRAGGAIGGRYYYEFHPTSIGISADCICGSCQHRAFTQAHGDYQEYKKLLKAYDAKFEFSEL